MYTLIDINLKQNTILHTSVHQRTVFITFKNVFFF